MSAENKRNRFANLMIMIGVPVEMAACSAAVTGTNNNETALAVAVGVGVAMIGLGIISALVGRDTQTEIKQRKDIKTKTVEVKKSEQPNKIQNPNFDVSPEEEVWLERKN